MYKIEQRIGLSQTGNDGKCKIVSMIDMLQDCSFYWLESEPVFETYFNDNNLGIIVAFRQLDILRQPDYKEKVSVCTSIYDSKGFFGYRNTAIYDINGNPCALSWLLGVFVDIKANKMIKLPQSVLDSIVYDKKIDMEYTPKKIILPQIEPKSMPELQIRRSDIDMYNHVNNARYIELALEILPPDCIFKRIRVEYKNPAKLEDTICPKFIQNTDDLHYVILTGKDSQVYAIVEFSSP